MTNTNDVSWLSTEAVAERYGVPEATVRKWRHEATGPFGVRLGRHVRYALAELERWEREQVAKQVAKQAS